MSKKTVNVLEYAASVAPRKVDRERGIIHDVKVLGFKSLNGPRYAPAGVSNAVTLYDGRHVYVGHPDRIRPDAERSPRDLFGWLERPHVADDGLYADLHYIKSHDMVGPITELAERRPDKLGLSHNAVVNESMHGNEIVYESIERVRSVDIVCRPATTRGIFESEEPMDETMAPAAPAGNGGSVNDMILAKVTEILNGDGDPAGKAKAIGTVVKELLKIEDKLEGAGSEASANSDAASVSESVQPKQPEKNRFQVALDVLESSGCAITCARVKLLAGYPDAAAMQELANTWPKDGKASAATPPAKPRSGSVMESQQHGDPKADRNVVFADAFARLTA